MFILIIILLIIKLIINYIINYYCWPNSIKQSHSREVNISSFSQTLIILHNLFTRTRHLSQTLSKL